ncbi:MAG TPA: hypothetical protein VM434_20335 [Beijerinckiaceae bacterium]|nr:hypothetical protein [Beijerinckiaceae bacterium]
MKMVCEVKGAARVVTTVSNDPAVLGSQVRQVPGVGQPFWMWLTLPAGTLMGADFTGAPVVSSDAAVNAAAIQAMLDSPPSQDVLIWA